MKTITAISIHRSGESPVFGEGVVTVRLDDEGGGAFFVLEESGQQVRVTADELDEIREAVAMMIKQDGVEE